MNRNRLLLTVLTLGLLFSAGLRAGENLVEDAAESPAPLYDPAKGEPGARHPAVSDDGKAVFFSLWGDLWKTDVAAGKTIQLTFHGGYDSHVELSPDGTRLAFSSDRTGNYDVYTVSVEGGEPTRLTWHSANDYVAGYSTDGRWIYFTSSRTDHHALWRIPVSGGTEELVLDDSIVPRDVSIHGGNIAYACGSTRRYRRGYQGSANEDLWLLREGAEFPERLTDFQGNDRSVQLLPDGRVLFTREVDRHFDLYLLEGDAEPRKLTSFPDVGAEEVSLSANGQWLVWQRMHYLYVQRLSDLLDGGAPSPVKIEISKDPEGPQVETRTFTSGASDPHLSNNGKLMAFALRGDIWVMAADGGEARQLTFGGNGDSRPRLSPDGKLAAFMSSRSGNADIWLASTAGGQPWPFTISEANDFYHNWSPDGQSIAFCSERSGNRDIWVKPLNGGPAVQLTDQPGSDDDPCFSPDGKTIAYDSNLYGTADLWLMDLDGSNKRPVVAGPDTEQTPCFSRDGRILYFERYVSGAQNTSLYAVSAGGGAEMLLATEAASLSVTPDDRFVIFEARNGGNSKIMKLPAPLQIIAAAEIPMIARIQVDLAQERVALFAEAWNMIRTRFYDPAYHGADWNGLYTQYLPLVQRCRTIEECYYYIWMVIGELSASHLGVGGRSSGSGNCATADLGADLEPVVFDDGRQGLKVVKIEKDGPLDRAWVREGDYLIAMNRRQFQQGENIWAAFDLWLCGYDFTLWISQDGTVENAREISVHAESPAQGDQRRYNTLINEREKRVSSRTKNKVLYVHLTAMDDANLQKFRTLLSRREARNAAGLIIDARGNRGGLSYMQIMELLSFKPYLDIHPRTRGRWVQPRLYWDRPVTVMCDQKSNSGGECFPWAIKFTGRGKVVGERTPGNVIGTHWDRLSDGSYFGVPTEGYFSMDGKRNLENDGVRPDIEVLLDARDRILGLDPQLEVAIDTILKEMDGEAPEKAD